MILFFYYSSVIIHLYSSAAWWYYRESLQYRRRFEFWSWLLNTFLLIFYLRSLNQMWISWKSLWHIAKLQCLIYIAVYSSIHPFLFIIAIFPASLQGYLPLIISLPLFICSSSLEKMVCLYPSYLAWQYLPVCGVKKTYWGFSNFCMKRSWPFKWRDSFCLGISHLLWWMPHSAEDF